MNHAELSRELALALGYYPESVRVGRQELSCQDPDTLTRKTYRHDCEVFGAWHGHYPYWRDFDYRDSTVVLPLLEWLGIEHQRRPWYSRTDARWRMGGDLHGYDTLAAAVAKAVIAVKGEG